MLPVRQLTGEGAPRLREASEQVVTLQACLAPAFLLSFISNSALAKVAAPLQPALPRSGGQPPLCHTNTRVTDAETGA
jgi:hypothetical protein